MIPDNWNTKKLEKVAIIQTGIAKGKKNIENPIVLPYLRVANVQAGYLDLSEIKEITLSKDKINRYLLKKGDVLLTEGGDYDKLGRGTIWNNQIPICVHQNHIFVVRTKLEFLFNLFFSYLASSNYGKRYFLSCAKQTTNLASINSTQLKKFPVLLPPLEEQKKIAEILSTWDKAIALTEKLIAAKQKLKKSLIQKILSSSFWTGKKESSTLLENDWKYQEFNLLFGERKETSSNIKKYPLYSLTIEEGLIEKPERYNREFLLKDKKSNQYKIAYPGDFVYNPMNLRFGAIALSQLNYPVAISAYYNVLVPNLDLVDPLFIFSVLKSPRMIYFYNSFGKGSLEEKKRVHLGTFLKFKIPLASIKEQNYFAYKLNTVTKNINLYVKYLDKIEQQKRGLMQKLLTGEWRVNTEKVLEETES